MIRSMTGYGRAQASFPNRDVTVEIKSVNHRYFELNARLPRSLLGLEDPIRARLREEIVRGKVELNLTVASRADAAAKITVDRVLLGRYLTELRDAAGEFGLRDDLTASSVLRFPSVVSAEETEEDPDEVREQVLSVLDDALNAFLAQREAEGRRLADDIIAKCGEIRALADRVEEVLPALISAYEARLRARIADLLGEKTPEESRILTEVALMADKTAVDEELVRLRSHAATLEEMLSGGISNGKKMDFIIQELNREVNTMTSKISDLEVTRIAIEMKATVEKIREQVQNIE